MISDSDDTYHNLVCIVTASYLQGYYNTSQHLRDYSKKKYIYILLVSLSYEFSFILSLNKEQIFHQQLELVCDLRQSL